MRVEMWVASPEPAVGVFTPAGTCPGRLRRHCVIGCADPGQNPPAVRSRSSRVRGRGWAGQRRGRCPGAGLAAVMMARAPRLGVGHDRRRRIARARPCRTVAWRARTRCRAPGMAATEGREGCGNCRSIACSVNRFVNRTRRDSTRRGRRSRQSEMGSVLSAEVTMPARDSPRRPETRVVWLITQRSRVQIPPPLPSLQVRGLFRSWKGPSACAVCTELCTRPLRRAAAAAGR